ncbi:hypothetical protein FB107DRAFT_225173 [Schizophyllum commune]
MHSRPHQHVEVVLRDEFYHIADRQPILLAPARPTAPVPFSQEARAVPTPLNRATSLGVSLSATERLSTPASDADFAGDADSSSNESDSPADDVDLSQRNARRRFPSMASDCDGWSNDIPGPRQVRGHQHGHDSRRAITPSSVAPNRQIQKPPGECGKPSNGGYSMQETLGWSPRKYKDTRKAIYGLVDKILDPARPLTKQSEARVKVLEEEAIKLFPELNTDYEERWPIRVFAGNRLHYLQNNALRLQQKKELERLQQAGIGIEASRS